MLREVTKLADDGFWSRVFALSKLLASKSPCITDQLSVKITHLS